ncbi:hypothetical protein DRO69_00485 [Candidatus Bathyarchaeota archaeon]|nr:MAG: hypothetical protein DRO69_00485 [Candidatus Bathyarchaeota archaeon]
MKVKLRLPDGRVVDAEKLDFEVEKEPWLKIKCSDGTVLKMKVVIKAVFRLNEHIPQTGEPMYFVFSENILSAFNVPKHLMKEPEKRKEVKYLG